MNRIVRDAMSEMDDLVNELIKSYRLQNVMQGEAYPRVTQITSGRTGAYDLAEIHEDAAALLRQLAGIAKSGVEEPERERPEIGEPPLLVLAKRVRTFTTYFYGLKNDKPVWCYQELLAARLNFAEAAKTAATLGTDVFALPANERRALKR